MPNQAGFVCWTILLRLQQHNLRPHSKAFFGQGHGVSRSASRDYPFGSAAAEFDSTASEKHPRTQYTCCRLTRFLFFDFDTWRTFLTLSPTDLQPTFKTQLRNQIDLPEFVSKISLPWHFHVQGLQKLRGAPQALIQ